MLSCLPLFIATTLWCGSIWVMPGTETPMLPQAGCYSCCDFDHNISELGIILLIIAVTMMISCQRLFDIDRSLRILVQQKIEQSK